MVEAKLSEKEISLCIDYYFRRYQKTKIKCISKILIPDNKYFKFLFWLDKCEAAELPCFFKVIEPENGYKHLYGFTNFEIKESEGTKITYCSLQDDTQFTSFFSSESDKKNELYLIPANLCAYVKAMKDIDIYQTFE